MGTARRRHGLEQAGFPLLQEIDASTANGRRLPEACRPAGTGSRIGRRPAGNARLLPQALQSTRSRHARCGGGRALISRFR
jgi:hypothetical protein